jgi:hypothetical protein
VPSLGPVTLATLENQVGSSVLAGTAVLLITPLARMCYAYQQLNDIGMVEQILAPGGSLKRICVHRYREKYLPEHHGGENALGPVLTQAGARLPKERSTTVDIR